MEDFDNPEVGQLLEAPSAPKPEPFENSEVNALVDPEWQHRQLERKRQEYAGEEQSLLKRGVLSSVPFASAIAQTVSNQHYGAAKEKFAQGAANEQDIDIMAEWERRHQEEAGRSLGGKIGSALLGVPAIAGEAMATPFSLPVRGAGGFILNKAIQAQLMPSMTLQHASARAAEQGGSTFDPQNLAPAAAFSAVQNMVLGSLGHVASGVANPAARFLAKTAAGVGEMQGANVLAGAVDEILPEAYQTKTRYGALGSFLRGEAGDAARQLAVDTVTMAAFTALHGNPGLAKEMVAETAESLDAKAKAGEPREKAAAAVREEARQAQLKIGDTEVLTPQSKDLNPAERYAVDKYGENKVLRVGLNGPDGPIGSATLAEEGDTIHVAWVGKTGLAGGEGRGKNLFGAREVFSLATQLAEAMPEAKFLKYTVSEGRIGEGKAKIADLDAIRRRGQPKAETPEAPTLKTEPSGPRPAHSAEAQPAPSGPEASNAKTPPAADLKSAIHRTFTELMRESPADGMVKISDVREAVRREFGDKAASHEVLDEILWEMKRAKQLKWLSISDRSRATEKEVNGGVKGVGEQFFYLEHVEAPPAPEAPGASNAKETFKTSLGSTYEAHGDGTTTRTKTDHTAHGHEATDQGAKERSARTVYVADNPSALSSAGLNNMGPKGARLVIKDGKATLLTWNEAAGRWGAAPSGRDVPVSDKPAVGLHPLELWQKADDVPGHEAYRKQHAGNKITEVSGGASKAIPSRPEMSVDEARAFANSARQKGEKAIPVTAKREAVMAAADKAWADQFMPTKVIRAEEKPPEGPSIAEGLVARSSTPENAEKLEPTGQKPLETSPGISEVVDPLAEAYRNKGITKRDQDIHQRLINGESGEVIAQSHRMTRSRVNQIKDEVDAKVGAGLTVEDQQQEMALQRAEAAKTQGRVRNTATSEQAQAEQAQVDESEPKADIGKLSDLIKEQFDEGNRQKTRWHVERMRQILLDNWFTPEEVDAAFSAHKMPPRGKAPGEPGGGRVRGANAQRNSEAFDYYLKRAFMDALAPKEMADVKSAGKEERVSDAEVRRRVASAYEEALRFSDRQVASETAAGEGHTGDAGDFNPDQLEGPDPARVERLMKMGYSRKAAEERAAEEEAKRQHPQQAMGAAALGELTQEAQTPESDQRLTSLAHAQTDIEREALGLKEAAKRGGYPDEMVNAAAVAAVQADPQTADKLLAELEKKTRPLDPVETVVVEHKKVTLNNALDQFNAMLEHPGLDAIDKVEYQQKARETLDQIDRLMDLTDRAGSSAGAAFRLRRQLMAEDYSAVGLKRRATAAKGEPLTPEEEKRIDAIAGRVKAAIREESQAAEAFTERAAQPGEKATTVATSPEWKQLQEAKTSLASAKGQAATMIGSLKPRTPGQKLTDILTKLRVNWVISGPKTLAKLFTASTGRLVTGPLEETAGAIWSRLPGIAKIAALAPREGRGLSLGAEKQAQMSAWMDGLKDAWKTIKTGKSDIDVLHGGPKPPRSWLDWQFSLHDAIKAPAVRAEYTRSFLNRVDQAAKAGKDATSPAALMEFSLQAYKDSQAAKFRQENWLVDAVNKFLTPGPKAGPIETFVKISGKMTMPVLRIPTNLAFETANYVFGLPRGAVNALHARYVKGLENLEPKQADAIMQQFKKGSLGAAALLIGAMNPQMFGGYYAGSREEEAKRRRGDVEAGAARVGGVNIPAFTQHIPFLQVFQIGATFRRAYDHVVAKEGKAGASVQAAWEAANGWLEEIPLTREANLASHLTDRNAKTRGYYFGELAKSLAIPQLFQWVAGEMDKPHAFSPSEDSVKRKPEGVIQHVEMGIPGLRKKVPAK